MDLDLKCCKAILKSNSNIDGKRVYTIEIVDLEGECINKDNMKKPCAKVITDRLNNS